MSIIAVEPPVSLNIHLQGSFFTSLQGVVAALLLPQRTSTVREHATRGTRDILEEVDSISAVASVLAPYHVVYRTKRLAR